MSPTGWPASYVEGRVGVRPLRLRDAGAWTEVRVRNEQWLRPWEGRHPALPEPGWVDRHSPAAFAAMLRLLRKEARGGRSLPFAVTWDGRLVGQMTVGQVVRGAFDSATVGYWVDGALAGRGITPTALALVLDHCFGVVGLHRVEADIRPENTASRRVVEKLGFRHEGLHERFMFIDDDWRDHLSYALLHEDVPEGVLRRWRATHRATSTD